MMNKEISIPAKNRKEPSPWSWVPSLYYIQGLPYIMVMGISAVMYKNLGISNTEMAFYTSILNIPWIIKPFWSPFLEMYKTKRWWIIGMQSLMAITFAGIAFSLETPLFFSISLALLGLIAFSSATHDIAADGFYILTLKPEQQSFYIGIRSTFYRLAMLTGQGAIVFLVGWLVKQYEYEYPQAWSFAFITLAITLILVVLYHQWYLPKPIQDQANHDIRTIKDTLLTFGDSLKTFFYRKEIFVILGFILCFRLGEAQLVKIAAPFIIDAKAEGGLGLDNESLGLLYGTIGMIGLTLGGILGGMIISIKGLRFWILPMTILLNLPNALYIYLAAFQPESLWIIGASIATEQFFYGFSFTAYLLYMIYVCEGKYKTAHYAFCTGLMALGVMLPQMFSGWIQEQIGYTNFFIWVVVAALPGIILTFFLNIDPEFGKKKKEA